MKTLAWALPWLLVSLSAIVYALMVPAEPLDSVGAAIREIKRFLVPMLLAGIVLRLGLGISEGIEEGLKQSKQPRGPEGQR